MKVGLVERLIRSRFRNQAIIGAPFIELEQGCKSGGRERWPGATSSDLPAAVAAAAAAAARNRISFHHICAILTPDSLFIFGAYYFISSYALGFFNLYKSIVHRQ